jgi:hypothetical protein
MIGATAATVVLASRASLDTHRGTIEVLHLMGATDAQVHACSSAGSLSMPHSAAPSG